MTAPLVLLLHPQPAARDRLQRLLRRCCAGCDVAAVADLPELERQLGLPGPVGAVRAPAVILVDLPPEHGVPLLGALRTHAPLAAVPVLALAEAADRRAQEAWYRGGANSVMGRGGSDAEMEAKLQRTVAYWTTVNVSNRYSRT